MTLHSREWLSCTGCGEAFNLPDNMVFQYTDLEAVPDFESTDGRCWPVLEMPCWCVECNRPSFAERIPTLKELLAAVAVQRIPEGDRKHDIQDDLLQLEPDVLRSLVEAFSSRASKSKCLMCGSQSFIPLERWNPKTPLLHDTCGSELTLHLTICGGIGKREFRYYTSEGALVGSLSGVA